MKWAYYVKYKVKAAAILTLILGLILCSIFLDRQRYSDLDHSVSSIYQDRLVPATYIFEITDHLYQKRLLHEQFVQQGSNTLRDKSKVHDQAITSLIKSFEATVLTTEERLQLEQFKSHLLAYNSLEDKVYDSRTAGSEVLQLALVQDFDKTMYCLNALSKIQAGEGMHLTKDSKSLISGSINTTHFEMALLIVLGLYILVLLSASDKVLFENNQKQVWN